MKTLLEKLQAIEKAKCIYNIHYCNAGVGFIFYDETKVEKKKAELNRELTERSWRDGLTVDRYYPSFPEAVEAEYVRLS